MLKQKVKALTRRLATFGLIALLTATAAAPCLVQAQTPTPSTTDLDLTATQRDLKRVEAAVPRAATAADIDALRDQAASIQSDADAFAARLQSQVSGLDIRLAQLGPAPRPASSENPVAREERRTLTQRRTLLDGQLKTAKMISLAAAQAYDDLAENRREAFNRKWLQRADSPLSPSLWRELGAALPRDFGRLNNASLDAVRTFGKAPEPRTAIVLGVAALLAAAIILPLRHLLEALGRRRAKADAPASPLRRSGYALWVVLVGSLTPALAVVLLHLAAQWTGALSDRADKMAMAFVIAVIWGAVVISLGRGLLSADRPSWRLPPLSDAAAQRFRPYVWIAAGVTGGGLLLTRLNTVIGASLAATVAADFIITLAYVAVAGAALVSLGRGRKPLEDEVDPKTAARSSGWTLVALALSLAIVAALAAAILGYTALATLIARQMYWISALVAAAYLLVEFIDDAVTTLFAAQGWVGRALFVVFGLRRTAIDQFGVVISAALRVLVWLLAVTLMVIPFGQGAGAWTGMFGGVSQGFKIGQVTVAPGALMAGVLTLVVVMALVRAVRRWFDTRYLPATDWDPGVRNSVSTAVSYLGTTLAILWALAAAGLGLQQIALIASALSVGIGFGLQAVVQNFVSGLILLVERPVKVGDWVVVGGVEGDVRHIRVRATEIQTFDRTTLLVPNSELITKTLQNKTLGDPRGRIRLDLTLADPTYVETARQEILRACVASAAVLSEPEPKVFIDGMDGGSVKLVTYAYVATQRAVYSARSDLYFDVLKRLREANAPLVGAVGPTILEPGEAFGHILERTIGRSAAPPNPTQDA